MTPENKIKFKANAQARSLVLLPKKEAEKRIETNYYVEGYAARYEPYVLCYDGDEPIYERFERGCFDDCDMSDVIMQFDHAGRVFARSTNGSLIVVPAMQACLWPPTSAAPRVPAACTRTLMPR